LGQCAGFTAGSAEAALFVIQVQDDFIPPDEFMGVEDPEEVLAGIMTDAGFHPRRLT